MVVILLSITRKLWSNTVAQLNEEKTSLLNNYTIPYHKIYYQLVDRVNVNLSLEKSNKFVGKHETLKQMFTIVVCHETQLDYVI